MRLVGGGGGCWLEGGLAREGLLEGLFPDGRPDAALHGGSMKYLFDCLDVRVFKNRHRSPP